MNQMILDPKHPDIQKIVKKINSGTKPVLVPVKPEDYAKIDFCIPAVKEKVKNDGGCLILGRMLFHQGFMIDGVFHGVWQSPEKDLIDVTPKQPPMNQILFLPYARLIYEERQIDSIRINLSGNVLVDDLMTISELFFKFMNAGDRKFQHGEVRLQGRDAEILNYFNSFKQGLLTMINGGQSRNKTCFCGRNKKYKNCHGKDLSKTKKTYSNNYY